MNYRDNPNLTDQQRKWANWSMHPEKPRPKLTSYACGLVIALTAFIGSGFHQNLLY